MAFRPHFTCAAAALLLAGLAGPAAALPVSYDGITIPDVGLTQRIVTDAVSGIALGGFDPVAYFVDGKPVRGSADYELVWAGAAWRFANAGNLAAFQAHPEIYAPRFGGYDPVSMAGGRAVKGDPQLFAIRDGLLYLFRSSDSRRGFAADATRLAQAATAWISVEGSLVD